MSHDSPDPLPEEFVDAFIQPPTVVNIARRDEHGDGRVRILSLVELWPWRVVVRGVRANRFASAEAPEPHGADELVKHDGADAGARVSVQELSPRELERMHREEFGWLTGWRISDDDGTEYGSGGAGRGGTGGSLWMDFHVEFAPGVPVDARTITIQPPDGAEVVVSLLR